MSDERPETQAGPVVKVARDLREIENLYEAVLVQAIHKAGARIDGTSLPGGEAMVALAGVGSPEVWERRVELYEAQHLATCERLDHTRCRYAEHVADEDGAEPVLQTLLFWSEAWRTEAGYSLDRSPSIATEVNFIRGNLNWAWDNLIEWDDFAADIRQARVRLENLLYAGSRVERTRIVCDKCDASPRLIRLHGVMPDQSDDMWKCPGCKYRFDADELRKAHAKQLRSAGAEKWVHQVDAIGTLKAQGRPERTVRSWLAGGEGSAYCDPVTHEVWVWWPDLWRKHLVTPTRNREVA